MAHAWEQTARRSAQLLRLRGDQLLPPDGSIVVPVNAQADMERVLTLVDDLLRYAGQARFEIVLVVNNYPAGTPPALAPLEALGLRVVARPDVRVPGLRVAICARSHGVRAAAAALTIHLDADCRVPDPTALLDWYVGQFRAGARAAYSPVGFFDLSGDASTRARIAAHHLARWFKRRVLGVPTMRGSNFALERALMLELFDAGYLPADFSLGPVLKARGERVAYGGGRALTVLTSGRYFERGWGELARYLSYRLRYNLTMLRARAGAANPDDAQHNTNRAYQIHRDDARPDAGADPRRTVNEKSAL